MSAAVHWPAPPTRRAASWPRAGRRRWGSLPFAHVPLMLLASLAGCGGGGGGELPTAAEGPRIASFVAAQSDLQEGQSTQLTANFSGGTARLMPGALPLQSGQAFTVSPADNTRYTLLVSDAQGRQASSSLDLRIVLDLAWEFDSAADWQLQATPADLASAGLTGGALLLAARGEISEAGVRCGEVAASVSFGDTRLRAGRYTSLSVQLAVQAWDLGLGRFDTNRPVLSLAYAGEQVSFAVSGFARMPALARIDWGHPATLQLDGVTVASAMPAAAPAGTPPRLSLQANGCSEGLSQRLLIDRISLAAR